MMFHVKCSHVPSPMESKMKVQCRFYQSLTKIILLLLITVSWKMETDFNLMFRPHVIILTFFTKLSSIFNIGRLY